jgi:hypothetical protein
MDSTEMKSPSILLCRFSEGIKKIYCVYTHIYDEKGREIMNFMKSHQKHASILLQTEKEDISNIYFY